MPVSLIKQFPLTGGPLIAVPTCGEPSFISFHVSASQTDVPVLTPDPVNPNLGWEPIVAVKVEEFFLSKLAQNRAPISINNEVCRAAFMLTRMVNLDPTQATPPQVDFQVRIAIGCTPEVVGQGIIKLTDFRQVGLIAQAGGWLATQYELWARISSAHIGAGPVALGIDIIVDRFQGGIRDFYKGSISV